ncbi:MAG: UDP-N-acetylglucosamine 1-carboxyvinyltransferase [Candidatus Levybacteria bacterium RIFCSPHIGHO2_01_FULL_38_26]|nr:MAG: UDP-N-acetylglucosamine 1-carboxyvinyltransferase [Candidatus Levybacteria bacterium RIFCSPHIGHO2_01_FULL_38_26]
MEKLVINGGKRLKGTISVSGAKNVALKTLVAACLTDEEVIIENVPLISDFMVMVSIIRSLGGAVKINDHTAYIQVKKLKLKKISLEESAKIRTSAMLVAPMLGRLGEAIIPNPGGCRIGARPIDRTIEGLKAMGAETSYNSDDGYFYIRSNGLEKKRTISYRFSKSTHTGTETLIMAAVLLPKKTVLENAAEEPEIDELIAILNKMGAKIERVKKRTIVINGVEKLRGARFKIGSDRNEIVTFAAAAIVTRGDVFIRNANNIDLKSFLEKLKKARAGYEIKKNGIRFYYRDPLKSTDIQTGIYPGFMTDWQGPWSILMTQADGVSTVHETVYENRFGYVKELKKMGADVSLFNPKIENPSKTYNFNLRDDSKEYYHALKVYGPTKLHNAVVEISDLRAGATLVLAALLAPLKSTIFGVEHLDRGYEKFEERLNSLGASIKRVKH